MKRIVVGTLALMLGVASLQAQDKTDQTAPKKEFHKHGGKPGMRGKHDVDFKKLNLTSDQQVQLKKIREDFKSQMAELKKSEATITAKDYKEKRMAIAKQHQEQMQNLLTQEQKDKLATMRSERGKKFNGGPGRGMDRMKTELGLSDDQSAKIKSLQADTRTKIKGIRDNQSLSDDQKKQQVMAAMKEQRENMNKVLTPDQLKKMEDMKAKRMNRDSK